MTSTHLAPGAPGLQRRPSTPLRRALGFEVRQHWDVLAFHGVIAVILVLLAWYVDVALGVVLILLAARLPADFVDRRPVDGRMLRSSLGISRADAVRARFLVVIAGQLLLAVAAAWIILLIDPAPSESHWSTFDIGSSLGPVPLTLRDHLVDIGLWSGAIAWSHALIGGEASRLDKRPTGRRAIALYLGVCLLALVVLTVSGVLTNHLLGAGSGGIDLQRAFAVAEISQAITVALTLGGGITALLMARRRWIRRA